MLEKEIFTTRVNSIDVPTGFEAILNVAGDIASSRNLGREEAEALSKFATITYRVNEIARDFGKIKSVSSAKGLSLGYEVGFNEKNFLMRKRISIKEYESLLNVHKKMAFNLYEAYLSDAENTRLAAREVQGFIANLLSKK